MKHDSLFVFDLDGVITDPGDSSIDDAAVNHIAALLQNDRYVAVNTGRSYAWVADNLLPALQAAGSVLERLYIVCEKGGESVVWDAGVFRPQPSRFALSDATYQAVKQAYDAHQQEYQTMFWDATKKTMATIEKQPAATIEAFNAERQQLLSLLRTVLQGQDVRIDATTIATDIESQQAGKHAGAELIYEWAVLQTGAAPTSFVSFGDSSSDYEMARYFAQQGAESVFVFVGPPTTSFTEDAGVQLVRTTAAYAAGTREYFENSIRE